MSTSEKDVEKNVKEESSPRPQPRHSEKKHGSSVSGDKPNIMPRGSKTYTSLLERAEPHKYKITLAFFLILAAAITGIALGIKAQDDARKRRQDELDPVPTVSPTLSPVSVVASAENLCTAANQQLQGRTSFGTCITGENGEFGNVALVCSDGALAKDPSGSSDFINCHEFARTCACDQGLVIDTSDDETPSICFVDAEDCQKRIIGDLRELL